MTNNNIVSMEICLFIGEILNKSLCYFGYYTFKKKKKKK